MKKLFVLAMVVLASFSAGAVYVDAANDQASKDLGASFKSVAGSAGWDVEGGTRYFVGTGFLVANNPTDGAWLLTAGHCARRKTTGETWNYLRWCFSAYWHEGFPKGATTYDPEKTIATVRDKVFYHPTQDIALLKLEHLVHETDGSLTPPVEFYHGTLSVGQTIVFVGKGVTGTIDQAGEYGTGSFDGYVRAARNRFWSFELGVPNRALMEYSSSLQIGGIAGNGDSGGFAAIEQDGKALIVGVDVWVVGSGASTDTAFEWFGFDPNFFSWMNGIIAANGNPNTPPVANAGPDQRKGVNATVTLDASESYDPDDDPLTYDWEFLSKPGDSAAELDDPTSAHPSFTIDADGVYTLQLMVWDGKDMGVSQVEVVGDPVQKVPGPAAPVVALMLALVGAWTTHRRK